MIGQYLSNTNENATVSQNIFGQQLNKALRPSNRPEPDDEAGQLML
jgi:hypothetical protein